MTEAFRRAVLRRFVRRALFDEDQAAGMLTWPHSGFHVHTAVWVPADDRAFATRLARSCARNPVALDRLTYDRAATAVTYRSDKSEGPTAGTETVDPLEFLARVLVHIPDKGHVTMRIVACITQASVIDRILTHLRTRACTAAPPEHRSDAPTTRGDVRCARGLRWGGWSLASRPVRRRSRGRRSRHILIGVPD